MSQSQSIKNENGEQVEVEFFGFSNTDNSLVDEDVTYTSLESCLTIDTLKAYARRDVPLHTVTWTDETDCSIVTENAADLKIVTSDKDYAISDYLLSVLSVNLDSKYPFKTFYVCTACDESVLRNFNDLFMHALSEHRSDDGHLQCCLSNACGLFRDCQALTNHWFLQHNDIIGSKISCFCNHCNRNFTDVVKFGKHICNVDAIVKKSKSNASTVCDECSVDFVSTRRLQFHQQFHMDKPRPKVCLVCFISFENDRLFYEHVTFAHEKFGYFFCRTCDKCYTIKSQFHRHEKDHTIVKDYICMVCDLRFVDTNQLYAHQAIHSNVQNECPICKKTFSRASQMRLHIDRNHVEFKPDTLPVCTHCDEMFVDPDQYDVHITFVPDHGPAGMSMQLVDFVACCEYCEAAFASVPALIEHRMSHPEPRTFKCQYCPRSYETYTQNKTHSMAHKSLFQTYPVKRKYVCDQPNCERTFDDWPRLRTHIKTMHLVNPTVMRCDQCEEVFYQSWTLKDHKTRKHQAPLDCPLCDGQFYSQSNLNTHVKKYHVDGVSSTRKADFDKRFKSLFRTTTDGSSVCIECDLEFANKKMAREHMTKVHPKKFECDKCPKVYLCNSDLNKHNKRKHQNNGKYQCDYCDERFTQKRLLTLHFDSKHPEFYLIEIDKPSPKSKAKKIIQLDYTKLDNKETTMTQVFRVPSEPLADHEYLPVPKKKCTDVSATELAVSSIIDL